ncbi:MAG: hypothetical protein V1922_03810 [bacterium]
MKNEKFCISKNIAVIFSVSLLLLAVVLFAGYMNKQNYSTTSKAASCNWDANTLTMCSGGMPIGGCSPLNNKQYICNVNPVTCKGEWQVDTNYRCLGNKYSSYLSGNGADRDKIIFARCIAEDTRAYVLANVGKKSTTSKIDESLSKESAQEAATVKKAYENFKSCQDIDPISGIPASETDKCTVAGVDYPIGYCSGGTDGAQWVCKPNGNNYALWSKDGSNACNLVKTNEIKSNCMAAGMEQKASATEKTYPPCMTKKDATFVVQGHFNRGGSSGAYKIQLVVTPNYPESLLPMKILAKTGEVVVIPSTDMNDAQEATAGSLGSIFASLRMKIWEGATKDNFTCTVRVTDAITGGDVAVKTIEKCDPNKVNTTP